jgi:hypothetical protein
VSAEADTSDFDDAVELVLRENDAAHQRGALPTWTIYFKPKDWPNGYIARRFEVTKEGGGATATSIRGDDSAGALQTIRLVFETAGMFCFVRNDSDHASVVETWI